MWVCIVPNPSSSEPFPTGTSRAQNEDQAAKPHVETEKPVTSLFVVPFYDFGFRVPNYNHAGFLCFRQPLTLKPIDPSSRCKDLRSNGAAAHLRWTAAKILCLSAKTARFRAEGPHQPHIIYTYIYIWTERAMGHLWILEPGVLQISPYKLRGHNL